MIQASGNVCHPRQTVTKIKMPSSTCMVKKPIRSNSTRLYPTYILRDNNADKKATTPHYHSLF